LKLSEKLDGIQNDLNNVKELHGNLAHSADVEFEYTDSNYKKDVGYVYGKAALEIGKLYAPAIVVGGISIAMLSGSHIQMSRRNTALVAAYATLQGAYEEYRTRVRTQLGEDRELELYRGIGTGVLENEDGKNVEVKVADPNGLSPYAKFFDEYSKNWEKDPEFNKLFIQCQQNYANNHLHTRGHLFLNDVYDMLGVDRSKAGAVVGWVIGKEETTLLTSVFTKRITPDL
jgi:hypothetical protein